MWNTRSIISRLPGAARSLFIGALLLTLGACGMQPDVPRTGSGFRDDRPASAADGLAAFINAGEAAQQPPGSENRMQEPAAGAPAAPISGMVAESADVILYYVQPGDTLAALAARFAVEPQEIRSDRPLQAPGLLEVGQEVRIPRRLDALPYAQPLLPDSEIVFSPSTVGFSVEAYLSQSGGALANSRQYVSSGMTSAADVIMRVAHETSFNPRLLLAIIEMQCGCVLGNPETPVSDENPLGFGTVQGLYQQLIWVADGLSAGYYGWRSGELTQLELPGGDVIRLAPELNAGTVALMTYFSRAGAALKEDRAAWEARIDLQNGFSALHERMFGKPWARAAKVEPLLPGDLRQPPLTLPIMQGTVWSYTGGPHYAWDKIGPRAAIDLASQSAKSGCVRSDEWIAAAADGVVTYVQGTTVVLDLDGDGNDQTGWSLLYVHVREDHGLQPGMALKAGDPIGHPTCEESALLSTGTHVHFARRYNGEWMSARDSVRFVLDGWVVYAGSEPYSGTMTKNGMTSVANPFGPATSWVSRPQDEAQP